MYSSIAPDIALQRAVYDLLIGDGDLIALLGGPAVYDEIPEAVARPYVQIGDTYSTPDNAHGEFGQNSSLTIHTWTGDLNADVSNLPGFQIQARIQILLDHRPSSWRASHRLDPAGVQTGAPRPAARHKASCAEV